MLEWLKTILGDHYSEDVDRAISSEIGKAFVSKSDFNAVNEGKKQLEADLQTRDQQLEELKKVDTAGLQSKIEELQTANATAKSNYEKRIADLNFSYALETALRQAKARNTKAVKALLDLEKIKFTDGKLEGLDKQLETLKTDSGYLFEEGKTEPYFSGPTPGAKSQKNISDDIGKWRVEAGLPGKTNHLKE